LRYRTVAAHQVSKGDKKMRHLYLAAALLLGTSSAIGAQPSQPQIQKTDDAQLNALFEEWRLFVRPAIVNGRPDYSAAAMAAAE